MADEFSEFGGQALAESPTVPPATTDDFTAFGGQQVQSPYDASQGYLQSLNAGAAKLPDSLEEHYARGKAYFDSSASGKIAGAVGSLFTNKDVPTDDQTAYESGIREVPVVGPLVANVGRGIGNILSNAYDGAGNIVSELGSKIKQDALGTPNADGSVPSIGARYLDSITAIPLAVGTGGLKGAYGLAKTGVVAAAKYGTGVLGDAERLGGLSEAAGRQEAALDYARRQLETKVEAPVGTAATNLSGLPALESGVSNVAPFVLPVGAGLEAGEAAAKVGGAIGDAAEGATSLAGKAAPVVTPVAAIGTSLMHGNPGGIASNLIEVAAGHPAGKVLGATLEKAAPAVGDAVGQATGAGINAAAATGTGLLYGLAGSESGDEENAARSGAAFGALTSPLAIAAGGFTRQALEQAAENTRLADRGAIAYGEDAKLDAQHAEGIKALAPEDQAQVNAARGFLRDLKTPDGNQVQLYVQPPEQYAKGAVAENGGQVDDAANSRGYYQNGTGKIFINADHADVPGAIAEAVGHEGSHAAIDGVLPGVDAQRAQRLNQSVLASSVDQSGNPTPSFQRFIDAYNGSPVDWANLSDADRAYYLREVGAQTGTAVNALQNPGKFTLKPEASDIVGNILGDFARRVGLKQDADLTAGLPGQTNTPVPADPSVFAQTRSAYRDLGAKVATAGDTPIPVPPVVPAREPIVIPPRPVVTPQADKPLVLPPIPDGTPGTIGIPARPVTNRPLATLPRTVPDNPVAPLSGQHRYTPAYQDALTFLTAPIKVGGRGMSQVEAIAKLDEAARRPDVPDTSEAYTFFAQTGRAPKVTVPPPTEPPVIPPVETPDSPAGSTQPPATIPAKRPRSFTFPSSPMGDTDVIDQVMQNGGIISKGRMSSQGGYSPADYEGLVSLPGMYKRMLTGNKLSPDQMAGALGYDSPQSLADAIHEAIKTRQTAKGEEARQSQLGQQYNRFDKEVQTPHNNAQPVPVNELKVGDTVNVKGQEIRVKAIDPNTGEVTLEDHTRYGLQKVQELDENGNPSLLYVESAHLKEPAVDDFGSGDEPPTEPPVAPELDGELPPVNRFTDTRPEPATDPRDKAEVSIPGSGVMDKPITESELASIEREAASNFKYTGPKPSKKTLADNPDVLNERMDAAKKEAQFNAVADAHAASLAPDDQRVQMKVDPDTGARRLSGKYFLHGDAFHDRLLANLPEGERANIGAIQEAIDSGDLLNFDYDSAKEVRSQQTNLQRQESQAQSSASGRIAGVAPVQEANKAMRPLSLSVGRDGTTNLYGYSPDKLLGNADNVLQIMRNNDLADRVPYRDLNDPLFKEDVAGYIANHANGYKGDGSGRLTATEAVPVPDAQPGYEPYHLPPARANLMNIIMGEQPTLSEKQVIKATGKPTRSAELRQFAGANDNTPSEAGEVNPLRDELNRKGLLKVGTDTGSADVLHPVFETVKPALMSGFKDPSLAPDFTNLRGAPFRGDRRVLAPEGRTPNSSYAGAGFLPSRFEDTRVNQPLFAGREATGFSEAERGGRTFVGSSDQKPRFEIDDRKMELLPKGGNAREIIDDARGKLAVAHLGQIIGHNVLFENYPDLANIPVGRLTTSNPEHRGQLSIARYADGTTDYTLAINPNVPRGELLDTITHELQHVIQSKEGFPGGANYIATKNRLETEANTARQKALSLGRKYLELKNSPRIAEIEKKFTDAGATDEALDERNAHPEMQSMIDTGIALHRLIRPYDVSTREIVSGLQNGGDLSDLFTPRDAMSAYLDSPGEVEARKVASRRTSVTR